ncbi:hypothetical protein KUW19_03260 [Ferrimonas balearica]|uniref:hypothetical protein n=1 Tax=Ferrimonas balearica TaxID=44012 RepID=UPI001C9839AD|nr:hypothetical protein [Ferrimonas balearica]MBY6105505.1 hypothetical protein [Ferrimonas balearica]
MINLSFPILVLLLAQAVGGDNQHARALADMDRCISRVLNEDASHSYNRAYVQLIGGNTSIIKLTIGARYVEEIAHINSWQCVVIDGQVETLIKPPVMILFGLKELQLVESQKNDTFIEVEFCVEENIGRFCGQREITNPHNL